MKDNLRLPLVLYISVISMILAVPYFIFRSGIFPWMILDYIDPIYKVMIFISVITSLILLAMGILFFAYENK